MTPGQRKTAPGEWDDPDVQRRKQGGEWDCLFRDTAKPYIGSPLNGLKEIVYRLVITAGRRNRLSDRITRCLQESLVRPALPRVTAGAPEIKTPGRYDDAIPGIFVGHENSGWHGYERGFRCTRLTFSSMPCSRGRGRNSTPYLVAGNADCQ